MVSRKAKRSCKPAERPPRKSRSLMEEHGDEEEEDLSNISLHSPAFDAVVSSSMTNTTSQDGNPGTTKKNEAATTAAAQHVNLRIDIEEGEEETGGVNPDNERRSNDNEGNEGSSVGVGPLYKSSRLRGYITLALASFINFDAADNSAAKRIGIHVSVITSTPRQRGYADAVAVVSLIISAACFLVHIDRLSPLRKFWQTLFKPGSKFEGLILAFLTTWWTVAAGVNTSVRGLAGDGRGQFSLYYSTWVCCFACYWMVERWCVAAGLSSFKSFINSWPNRSPAWICLLILSVTTSIWYLDLWQNHNKLTRPSESLILSHFNTVSELQWQWLVIVTITTFCPSIVFVLIELFRGTNPDGSITAKPRGEIIIEGCCFLALALAWIPTVMIATTPRGAASLIGNAYFCTWINAIAVCEGLVWFIHDKRRETHELLQRKRLAYVRRQEKVMEEALDIQKRLEQKEAVVVVETPSTEDEKEEEGEKEDRSPYNIFETETGNSTDEFAEI